MSRRNRKGLRLKYIDLLWMAKKLSSLSKDPTLRRRDNWKVSEKAKELKHQAEFYGNFLDAVEKGNKNEKD